MAAKKTPDTSTAALAQELRSLIPKLDTEGLQFLVDQAKVHLYNMQVDEINRSQANSIDTKAGKAKPGKAKTAGATGKDAKGKKADDLRIEGTESGSSFYIVYRGQWVMFSRDEIGQMVRIVSAPVTELEQREHLFEWFRRERRDVFAAIPMADKFDERLKKTAALLRKNFRAGKQQ